MLIAVDFVDETRLLLDDSVEQDFISRYADPELLVYLRAAYHILQKDAPQFMKKVSIPTTADTTEYHIDDEIVDGIKLSIDGNNFIKTDIRKIFDLEEEEEDYYCTNNKELHLNKAQKDGATISFRFYRIKQLLSLDSEILLPLFLHESLRLLFLSRTFEKMPSRNDRNLSVHYLKRYRTELTSALKSTKQKHTGLRSSHQKI